MAMYFPKSDFQRYVFYTSLKTHPGNKIDINDPNRNSVDVYNQATGYLNAGMAALRGNGNEEGKYKQALALLKAIADNEFEKERAFLASKMNEPAFPQSLKRILVNYNPESFDYTEFLRGLNMFMLRVKNLEAKIDEELSNMKTISSSFEKAFRRYREDHKFSDKVSSQERQRRFVNRVAAITSGEGGNYKTRSYLFGEKRDDKTVPSRLNREDYGAFISAKDAMMRSKFNISQLNQRVYKQLSDQIVAYLSASRKEDILAAANGDAVAKNNLVKILDYLVVRFYQDYLRENANITSTKERINEMIRQNAELLPELTNEQIPTTFPADFQQAIDDAYNFFSKNPKMLAGLAEEVYGGNELSKTAIGSEMTRAVKSAERFVKELSRMYDAVGLDPQKLIIGGGKRFSVDERKWAKAKDQYGATEAFKNLEKKRREYLKLQERQATAPQVTKKSKGTLDIASGAEMEQTIEGAITGAFAVHHRGNLSGKDDVLSFYFDYTPPEIEVNQGLETVEAELQEAIDKYNSIVDKSVKGGVMSWDKLNFRTGEISKAESELTKALNSISKKLKKDKEELNIFVVHGSTKEYQFYGDLIGFHSGAIGAGSKLSETLGILKGLGVIDSKDEEWVLFAAANCARHLIGAEHGIQPTLENYLSLITGALVFEDSAAIVNEVRQSIQKSGQQQNGVKNVHLYRLNGYYFPLSYILRETYNSLLQLDTVISANNHGNKVHIINEAKWISFVGQEITEETWQKEWTYTQSAMRVELTFFAGFLDVLSSLKITGV